MTTRRSILSTGNDHSQISKGHLGKRFMSDTKILGIPFRNNVIHDDAVFRIDGASKGTFGIVYEGFDPRSGEARTVKRLVMETPEQYHKTFRAVEAL